MNKRELQRITTKEKIIQVAIEMIDQASFDTVTINQICKKADVTKGAFYHHFDSKSDIVAEYYKARVLDVFSLDPKDYDSDTYFDFVEEASTKFVFLVQSHGLEFSRQIYKHQIDNPLKYCVVEGDRIDSYLSNLVKKGQEKDEFITTYDYRVITRMITKFLRGMLYDWCIHDGEYDFEEVAKRDFHIFIQAFKK